MADASELHAQLITALQGLGGRAGNAQLRAEPGWEEELCARIRDGLEAQGRLVGLHGWGGGVALAGGGQPIASARAEADARSRDVPGRVWEYFLGQFAGAEGRWGDKFSTPRCVVRLLAETPELYRGRVYDPRCGPGDMCGQSVEFSRGNAGFAWPQHIVHHLAPNGRAGFVPANGSMSSNRSRRRWHGSSPSSAPNSKRPHSSTPPSPPS